MRDDSRGNPPSFECIHHVQIAMSRGSEGNVRQLSGTALAMAEVEKPPALAKRGVFWFRAGGVEMHLGVERDLRPTDKAHPAIRVDDVNAMTARLASFGIGVEWDGAILDLRRYSTEKRKDP